MRGPEGAPVQQCTGATRRSSGRAAVRAGSAAASAPAAPSMLRHGCPGRGVRPGSACSSSPGSPVPSVRSVPRPWHRPAVAPAAVRISRVPADQPPMRAKHRTRRHQSAHPQRPGQQARQSCQYRPVRPVELRPRLLAAQHRDLMAQHQQLRVLRRRRPCQQREPPGQPDEHQIQQPYRHKPAIMPAQQPSRQAYSQVNHLYTVSEPYRVRPGDSLRVIATCE